MSDTKIEWAEKHKKRFWKYVDLKMTGCWEWKGGLFPNGYGQYRVGTKKMKAHRVAYQLELGKIPSGMCVLHKCDNPKCVRPDHLFLGTNADNAADRDNKGRGHKGPCPSRGLPGELNPSAILTEGEVSEIRQLRENEGLTYKQLASLYCVSQSTIAMIVRQETWMGVRIYEYDKNRMV